MSLQIASTQYKNNIQKIKTIILFKGLIASINYIYSILGTTKKNTKQKKKLKK